MTNTVDPVFFADCAARVFFDQVANKWSVMILTLLNENTLRFNQMKRSMEGITHKALTQALRKMERNGLIKRTVLATSPVAVEYTITELGRSLQKPFNAMYDWAINHLDEILKKRRKPMMSASLRLRKGTHAEVTGGLT